MKAEVISLYSLAAVIMGLLFLGFYAWIQERRRIIRLEWPKQFQDGRKMKRYCRFFLRKGGWHVRIFGGQHRIELIITNLSHDIAVGILPEKYYFGTRFFWNNPSYFITDYASSAEKFKRPLMLVTDFILDGDIIAQCNSRMVYPVFYKDLVHFERIVPSKKQFAETVARLRR